MIAGNIICPECQKNGQVSEVYNSIRYGFTTTHFDGNNGSYDEKGDYHYNPIVTTYYSCSNGHKFIK